MSFDDEDLTWDTLELARWIDNDEGLYNVFHNAIGTFTGTALSTREFFMEYPVEGVDNREVDWRALVDLMDERED